MSVIGPDRMITDMLLTGISDKDRGYKEKVYAKVDLASEASLNKALAITEKIDSSTCKNMMLTEICHGYMKLETQEALQKAYAVIISKKDNNNSLLSDLINTCIKIHTAASIIFAVEIGDKHPDSLYYYKNYLVCAEEHFSAEIAEIRKNREENLRLEQEQLRKDKQVYEKSLAKTLKCIADKKIAEGKVDYELERKAEEALSNNQFIDAYHFAKEIVDSNLRIGNTTKIFTACCTLGEKDSLEAALTIALNEQKHRDNYLFTVGETCIKFKNIDMLETVVNQMENEPWKNKLLRKAKLSTDAFN